MEGNYRLHTEGTPHMKKVGAKEKDPTYLLFISIFPHLRLSYFKVMDVSFFNKKE